MEDRIEVGEYVRTKDGYIGKILKINKSKRECDTYYVTDTTMASGFYEHIYKHSKKLIDIIEEGDLCYYKVRGSDTIYRSLATVNSLRKIQLYFYSLEQIEIIKILTYEQIEDNCYKVVKE